MENKENVLHISTFTSQTRKPVVSLFQYGERTIFVEAGGNGKIINRIHQTLEKVHFLSIFFFFVKFYCSVFIILIVFFSFFNFFLIHFFTHLRRELSFFYSFFFISLLTCFQEINFGCDIENLVVLEDKIFFVASQDEKFKIKSCSLKDLINNANEQILYEEIPLNSQQSLLSFGKQV